MDRNEFHRDDYEDIDCFFCKQLLVFDSHADLDLLNVAAMVCWSEGHIEDLGDLGEDEGVCLACAERLVGPVWRLFTGEGGKGRHVH